jgi:NTP pyrophosphatase (non-canonical NTP hydrolase)
VITREDIMHLSGYETQAKLGGPMTLGQYSAWVETMIVTQGHNRLLENTLGLVGEAGEVAEKVKKYLRDGTMDKVAVAKELGDVLFYAVALANYLGLSGQHILDLNVEKLNDRKKRNQIQGQGDDR